MFRVFVASVRRLLFCQQGSVAVQIGVGMIALVGMVGLGTEGTFLLYKHRQMQSTSDSAAISGVMALSQPFPRDPVSEARAVGGRLGFVHGSAKVNMTVNVPPKTGGHAGNMQAVEVILSQPQDLSIMRLFGNDAVDVGTRSVAVRSDSSRFCILALDPTVSQAMYLSNNAAVPNPACGVAVNSNSNSALFLKNNASIGGPVVTRGKWSLSNNAELNGDPLIQNGPLIADPYANVQIQTPPPCTGQSGSGNNNVTRNLTPGYFCDGWDFKNNATLNLSPGTYYIDSQLTFKNNVVVNATGGVTIIVNGNFAIDVGNNATLNITAPSSGDYAGLAFLSRPDATSTILQKFSNNAALNIQGAIYFPNQRLELDNNGATNPNGCAHVIARTITLMNNANVSNNCAGTGVKAIGPPAQLVE